MRRRILSTLLAVCVLAGTAVVPDMSMNVRAEEYAVETVGVTSGDYEYGVLEDGTAEITGYHGNDTELVIPAEIDGRPVSSIGDRAFEDCSSLSNITLPDGITSIGNSAFFGCSSLSSIIIPEAVTSIEYWTFYNCSSLSNITIPEGVTSIGGGAFNGCSSLSSIIIPEGVTSIEGGAFSDCSSLSSIHIPDGVTTIEPGTFGGCSSLSSITIPEGVTSIGWSAFYNCSSLNSVTIPNRVTSIGNNAFEGCSSLKDITIPDGVTSIESYSFSGCSNLNSITIPEGVTSIGYGAFEGCRSLSGITLPDGVISIGIEAFSGCSSLRNITIPEGVISIGEYAFGTCRSLSSITIPNSVTSMDAAFVGCNSLSNITIPDSVTIIKDETFSGCSSLSSITIPDSVTSIGVEAFDQCSSLKHVYYNGTKEQWKAISIDNSLNKNADLYHAVIHCVDGDLVMSDSTQLNADNVQLSAAKVTYNGKAQTPTVVVKDNQGKTVAASNYTVQYANNQNVGQASITVTFKGSYSGTVTKTFDIVPKGTKISKATAKKKGFTVKWKKQTEQTTGYEIQYSTSSKFNGAKTAGNIKAKKTSKTISKLNAKKKYYIRIRTYKTVGGRNYYSDWSAKKSVKTKRS